MPAAVMAVTLRVREAAKLLPKACPPRLGGRSTTLLCSVKPLEHLLRLTFKSAGRLTLS